MCEGFTGAYSHVMAPSSTENPDTGTDFKADLWGYDVRSSSDDCIKFLNKYYIEVLSYGRDKRVILQAADADRGCALACGLAAASLWAPQKSKTLSPKTLIYLAAAKANLDKASSYEKLVIRALVAWIEHRCEDALAQYFEVLEKYPKDLLTLKRAQLLCFTMGWTEDMLSLALKALPSNMGSAYMFGMLAFALVEVGDISKAESAARLALTIEAQDVWAQHALCHALEYQCRFKEALNFMKRCCNSWLTCCSFMRDHNWWHVASCQLELGGGRALNKVLDLYDERIWEIQPESKSPQKYINALGLLLRLETRIQKSVIDDRILQVVRSLKERAFRHQELLLDVLSIWAFRRADHLEEASEMLTNVKCKVLAVEGQKQENLQCVISLAAALYEYGRDNLNAVAETLGPSFCISKLKTLGASNEQLDVFQDIWCIASLGAGHAEHVVEVAERLTRERREISFRWRVLTIIWKRSLSQMNSASLTISSQNGIYFPDILLYRSLNLIPYMPLWRRGQSSQSLQTVYIDPAKGQKLRFRLQFEEEAYAKSGRSAEALVAGSTARTVEMTAEKEFADKSALSCTLREDP